MEYGNFNPGFLGATFQPVKLEEDEWKNAERKR